MNTRTLLLRAAKELEKAGVPDPEYDSAILLSRVMDAPPLQLRMGYTEDPTEEELAAFRELMARRLQREPLQYIEGKTVFNWYEIMVRPGVLIPRPETAILVNWAGKWVEEWYFARLPEGYWPDRDDIPLPDPPEVLDLCCGSGCVGLNLKLQVEGIRITLTDLSPEAIALTRDNAAEYGMSEEVEILQGDLFAPVAGRTFDLILSNPPYIPSAQCDTLQAEVMREPRMALDGGADGLDFYRRIAAEAPAHLKPGGALILEIGYGQAGAIRKILKKYGAKHIQMKKDDAGIERTILAEFE